MTKCKNCGGDIMKGVKNGKAYWYHCVDFGDCVAEPDVDKEGDISDKI